MSGPEIAKVPDVAGGVQSFEAGGGGPLDVADSGAEDLQRFGSSRFPG